MGHVHPDLVGAPRLQPAGEVGEPAVAVHHLIVGDCLPPLSGATDGHPFPIGGVAGDGGVHSAVLLPEAPQHYRMVETEQGVVLELPGQGQVGPIVFGNDDQPRGVPVNAVDDAGAQLAIDSGQ